jgi:predicted flap endonuclease-1-like 5' DNA nuclease
VRDDILQTPADQQDEVAQAIAEEPLGQAALGEVMAAPETPGGRAASSEAEEAAQQIVSPEATAADIADDHRDNLTLIEGIGPRYQQALYAVGINTFAQLSGASDETLTRAVAGIGVARPASLDTWAEQAAYLARGDRAGFDQLVARLKSGRRADSNQR